MCIRDSNTIINRSLLLLLLFYCCNCYLFWNKTNVCFQVLISGATIGTMEESHEVFLPIPDVTINEEFYDENLPDEDLLHEVFD